MAFFIQPKADGGFELIDGDLLFLYPNIDREALIELSAAQYEEFCKKANELTRLQEGKLVYRQPDSENARHLEAMRAELIRKIADKTDRLKAEILAGYPQTEIDSFYRQEKEALALQADPNASAPMLREIAENRGVPLAILAQKVLEKAEQVAVVIGGIIGKRQGFEDRIQAVENAEEFAKLEQEIDQWQR